MDTPPTNAALPQYMSFPFDTDESFKQGLTDILSSNPQYAGTGKEPDESTLRQIRVFYFNRVTGNSLNLAEVEAYEEELKAASTISLVSEPVNSPVPPSSPSLSSTSLSNTSAPSDPAVANTTSDEPDVLTFAQLKALIESGNIDQIPNNKKIPDNLNDAPASESTAQTKKKPWEVAASSEA
ncbi:hypothetical protein D9758_010037 [Tetrapyrgos nigripes]|uniref:Uncharacterized protein n=1 Tax=Tetrapyrgos nigripes TaxID=182062 RepID=A0A8H5FSH6_9AGAR|nr:hypothetical protein D9758_010037 [Tetrapyrgos nigripes]